jgi:hypothetical protein
LSSDLFSADDVYEINHKGAQLPGAPKNTINGSLDYGVPLENAANLYFHVDGYYQSGSPDTIFSKNTSLNTVPGGPFEGEPKFYYPIKGYALFNASTSYVMGDWSATLWMKNIFNAEGVSGVYTQAYMGTDPAQNYYGNASKALNALPRTAGLTVDYKF